MARRPDPGAGVGGRREPTIVTGVVVATDPGQQDTQRGRQATETIALYVGDVPLGAELTLRCGRSDSIYAYPIAPNRVGTRYRVTIEVEDDAA